MFCSKNQYSEVVPGMLESRSCPMLHIGNFYRIEVLSLCNDYPVFSDLVSKNFWNFLSYDEASFTCWYVVEKISIKSPGKVCSILATVILPVNLLSAAPSVQRCKWWVLTSMCLICPKSLRESVRRAWTIRAWYLMWELASQSLDLQKQKKVVNW